jgi:hypothetical protein
MSQPINQEGAFRGLITEYALFEPKSGAVGLNIKAAIHEAWDEENQAWGDWREFEVEAEGCIWIIKKDGSINEEGAESVVKFSGWNGDLATVTDGTWKPRACAFTVKKDVYKDQTRFRIAYVNDPERIPGGMGNVSPERAKELSMKYGSQFRALAGNAARNATTPAGKPKLPAKPSKKPAPVIPPDQNLERDIDAANAELQEAGAKKDDVPW